MASRLDPSDLTDARIVVTGGNGFIGRHLIPELERAGAAPVVISHPDSGSGTDTQNTIVTDLADNQAAIEATRGADAIVHLAARAGGIQFQQEKASDVFSTNRALTESVLNAADHHGVERVFLASSMVIYRPTTRPLSEDDPTLSLDDRPDPYAWSKITDEVDAVWRNGRSEIVVGRFANVYGPKASLDTTRATVVHSLIQKALSSTASHAIDVWGDGSAVRSFIYVKDAARAIVTVLTRGKPGEAYNIDSGRAVTIRELAEVIRDTVNPELEIVFDPSKPAGISHRVGTAQKIQDLGFNSAVSLREGVEETVDWYRSTL